MSGRVAHVHSQMVEAFLGSAEVSVAILIGSGANGTADEFSDLDYFMYASNPNWPRSKALAWLQEFRIIPTLCYWSGVEKYHLIVENVGVDLSIRSTRQLGEAQTWPTLHFPDDAILKDTTGLLRKYVKARDPQLLRAGMDNTIHGFLYHALSCAIQLRRGEYINARSRFSGVIESFTCLAEGLTVGQLRWREPTRRVELRINEPTRNVIHRVAYAGSPREMRDGVLELLTLCGEMHELSAADGLTVERIRSLMGETL